MPFLQRQSVTFHFERTEGRGQPVVLIHGWCCDRTFLSPQADYFSKLGHQIISPDLRGHGLSDKPRQPYPIKVFADDVAWMCGELNLSKPILVGHSMGGIVAFDIAARYPNLPAAIVMLDSAIVLPAAARQNIPLFIEKLQRSDYVNTLRHFIESVLFLPSDDRVRKAGILDLMSGAPQHVMTAAYQGLADYDAVEARGRITVPSLYIAANEPSPRSDMPRLKDIIPQLNAGQTVGSGHFCQLEVPEQINAMIGRFVRLALVPNL
ncbi:alpha/beta hydrolase [Bradyrhizobium sp. WSM 1738]|uniref:alpha/beta fold hydrolase n=1 Tax=Bradyrhizobium hereditatis TaxID=2821405 RepID=UPI001CE2F012|nr:alpha/beta hydrolase [Bradyrhizobium hereditatis]MCA6119319.1 alpha/beta hydrolase [Bradyrhizobium hereditatis]